MKKIAVFASGSGSNFQAIINVIREGLLPAEISLLVCDQPRAFAIERAKANQIPCFIFSAKDYSSKSEYETEIATLIKDVDFIVLAGYMRLIGSTLLKE